jgi:hypothetical protein
MDDRSSCGIVFSNCGVGGGKGGGHTEIPAKSMKKPDSYKRLRKKWIYTFD